KVVDEQWGQLLTLSDALDFDLREMPLEDLFAQGPSLEVGLDQFLLLGVKVFESPLDPGSRTLLLSPGICHNVTDHLAQKGEHRGGNRHLTQPALEGLLQSLLSDVD